MKKRILLFFLIAFCSTLYPQNKLFVRVYDLKDKKINKGYVLAANDSVLRIKKDTAYIDIPVKTIGTIRTKRSIGNNILWGTLIGTVVVGSIGAASAEPDAMILAFTPAEGFIIGTLLGAPAGVIIGTLTAAFKNSKKFVIDGELEKWKAFQEHLAHKKT